MWDWSVKNACVAIFFIHVSVAANSKPGDGRSTFFEDHLKRLAHAAASGFDTLKQACKLTQSLVDDVYPSITTNSSQLQQLQNVPVHQYSKSILPQGWKHVHPLTCYGDGNCLYRYMHNVNFICHRWYTITHVVCRLLFKSVVICYQGLIDSKGEEGM